MTRVLALVLVFVAAALRVWQYAAGTSMWIDELWIASNVLTRSLPDLLLRPLDFRQVAPLGFLLLTKWSTLGLGSTEYALRLLPFLAGLASVFLFWRLARRAVGGAGLPIALALFAWNIGLLRYTSEAKQYELDAAAALALTLLALRLRDRPTTLPRAVAAGVAGLVVVWVSHASVLVLVGLGGALAICWITDRPRKKALPFAIVLSMWAIAATASVFAAIRHVAPSTAAFMKAFWREGFLPVRMPPPLRGEEYKGALAYLRDHRLPGDRIYVFTWANLGMQFYGPRFGFNESEYTNGGCYRDSLRPYLREIDEFRGAPRVWVILASVWPFRQARIGITHYLDAIGVRREGISYPSPYPFSPDGVFAYLYDLSDSPRLAAASWRDFNLEAMTFHPSSSSLGACRHGD